MPPNMHKMIMLTKCEVTPELEQMIRNTAEAVVFVMKQKEPIPVVVPAPMPDPIMVQPDMVIDPVQQSA